jgi:hypothetical protein
MREFYDDRFTVTSLSLSLSLSSQLKKSWGRKRIDI